MRNHSSARTHGPGFRARMALLFMVASAGILGPTAIALFLAKDSPGSDPVRVLALLLAALVAIVVVAFCSYVTTISVTRPLETILEFTRTITEGRLAGRLAVTGAAEAAALADALNVLATTLQGKVSRIDSVADTLTSIDITLASASGRLQEGAARSEAEVGATAGLAETIKASTANTIETVERLSTATQKSAGEIGKMTAGIEELAADANRLENSFDEVDSAIGEMAETGKRVGFGIVNLLDASSSTATAISQMDISIRQVKRNALDASSISEGVIIDAATGRRAMDESIAGMRAIRDSSAITAEVVENLAHRVKDIGIILSVIDELAEQTDLLALNATIIAAQAGEQGKGFAVVADEIRELAERTSSSTREIASVIRGVQDETSRAVEAINLAEASISEGEKLSQHSGAALVKMVSGVEHVGIQVREIARATVEQAHGSQSIRSAMEQVAELIDQIAGASAEQTKGCDRIAAATERMKVLATHFGTSVIEQGKSGDLITHAANDIVGLIQLLRESGRAQLQGCDMLARTLTESRTTAESGNRSASAMGDTLVSLSKQVNLLEKELSGFTIQ